MAENNNQTSSSQENNGVTSCYQLFTNKHTLDYMKGTYKPLIVLLGNTRWISNIRLATSCAYYIISVR